MVAWGMGKGVSGREEGMKRMIDAFITLIVVMISQVYTYAQTYQMVYLKYMSFIMFQLYLNKVFSKHTCSHTKFLFLHVLMVFVHVSLWPLQIRMSLLSPLHTISMINS